ncbi:phospholipase A and acyltransferase 3-like isoform X4 [Genypterus blacodes]|uniref:phospholipase A and acyltransferase 3-like isoform X4 n=1 Tax=Genypterus blacodes TaxID=154954 RepID=UPI003F76110E
MDQPLMPGDLIEIDRVRFKHWAVCIGNGEVVHLVALSHPGPSQMMSDMEGGVRRESLKHVVGNDTWKVNNSRDDRDTPHPPAKIVETALSREGKVTYNLTSNNCEHFANEVRYGTAESQQVVEAAKGVGKVLLGASVVGSFSAMAGSQLGKKK